MSEHYIEQAVFGRTASSLVCACGKQMDAATPEGLEEAWVSHRRRQGLPGYPRAGGKLHGVKIGFNPTFSKVRLPARS